MDRGTRVFWGLVVALLGASAYFGANAEHRRREVQRGEASVSTGAIVRLSRVVDGDTVLVQTDAGGSVAVRILGIKSFDPSGDKDPSARAGQAAVAALRKMLEDKPIRVLLNAEPKDKHGRTIATLFVDDKDVGLTLLKQGLVMAYPVFPFPALTIYLEEQEAARADRRGLWADAEAARRADLLLAEWRKGEP